MHETSNQEGSTPNPPAQLSEFPDINVRQEATNYIWQHAPTSVVEPPAVHKPPVIVPRLTYDGETISLKDLDRAHFQLVQNLLQAGTPITEAILDPMD